MPKVLLADDSTHAQRMGTKILSGEGIEVVSVSNGEAAVKKLAAAEFDVVFADVFMPGRTGYEVCNFIKNNTKYERIPVVLVVGQLEPFDPDQARKVGADAVLKKPFEPAEVLKTVQAMLQLVEERKPPPPPPPPSAEELAAKQADEAADAKAMQELTASMPQQTAVRMEVPEDMQHHAAFDLFEAPGTEAAPAAVAPGPAAEAAPAPEPSPAAPEVVGGTDPLLAPIYGVEPAVAPELGPTGFAAPDPVAMPEKAPSDVHVGPEVEQFDSAPPPPPPRHWAAEPEAVTDMDRAAFPPSAPAAVAEVTAPAPAPAPGSGEWADLLKSVEEPARVAAREAVPPPPEVEVTPPAPPEEVVASPAPVVTPSPAPVVTPAPAPVVTPAPAPVVTPAPAPVVTPAPAPVVTPAPAPVVTPAPAPEVVAPEPIPVSVPEPVAPAPEPAAPALDAATVRAAAAAAFDKALPTLKPVPGLLDTLTEEILERLKKKS